MTQYVIVLLGRIDGRADVLKATLERQLSQLGIPDGAMTIVGEGGVLARDRKAPVVVVYFGADPAPAPTSELRVLVDEAVTIVPVVSELSRFSSYIPEVLRPYNGFEWPNGVRHAEALAGVVLENFGLLRRSRRLFISYRRTETRSIAIQLYEALQAQSFDVFLDTSGVRPGEPFEDVLWHRFADSDIIVLLDSPGFLTSRWTERELARANTTNVQILQLIWPDHELQAAAAFSRPIQLVASDFRSPVQVGDGAGLTEDVLGRISVEVESLRARALAARYAYLVQEFSKSATEAGFSVPPQFRRFMMLTTGKKNYVIVPTIGVPDAVRYHEVEEEVLRYRGATEGIILLYDERGIRDAWLEHMKWLDEQLRVRSLQVTRALGWLRSGLP